MSDERFIREERDHQLERVSWAKPRD